MDFLIREACAKINVTLNVLGKRRDGFHEVETFLQAVDLQDRVRIGWELCPTGLPSYAVPSVEYPEELSVEVRTTHPDLAGGPGNIAYGAAVLMHETFKRGTRHRITVDIEKHIPIGAGLGGGSADAACVILALADLWKLDDSERERLWDIAGRLGSDVPFCLAAQLGTTACIATGRGEILRPTPPLSCRVLLATPSATLSARDVYAELREEDRIAPFDTEALAASAGDIEQAARYMGNHLQAPAMRLCSDIRATMNWVKTQSDPLALFVSGSGPTVAGVYTHGSSVEDRCTCHPPSGSTRLVSTLLGNLSNNGTMW